MRASKGILRVSPNGGVPEVIAPVETDQIASLPQTLPGGKAVLFTLKKGADNWDTAQVVVQRIGGERKPLVETGADGRYLPTGHLVYTVSGMLLAVPFDPSSLAVVGGPVPVVEGIRRTGLIPNVTGAAQFSYSRTGMLVYLPGPVTVTSGATGTADLALFDRKGTAQPFKLKPGAYRSPRASPDGKFIAFDSENDREAVVWIYEVAGGTAMRRPTFGGKSRSPVWSPDGQWVAFQSDRDGDRAIFQQRADGNRTAERLTRPETGVAHTPHSWSPDGAYLLFAAQKDNLSVLWTLSMKDRKQAPFSDVRSAESAEGAFSPDGRWIAYHARESTATPRQVFVEPFPSTGAKYLVREGGSPYWSPKGTELILSIGPGQSVIIPVRTAPRVAFGQPVEFSRRGRSEGNPALFRRNADSMPDGAHIVGVTSGASGAADLPTEIIVVVNWFDEVRQRAPRK